MAREFFSLPLRSLPSSRVLQKIKMQKKIPTLESEEWFEQKKNKPGAGRGWQGWAYGLCNEIARSDKASLRTCAASNSSKAGRSEPRARREQTGQAEGPQATNNRSSITRHGRKDTQQESSPELRFEGLLGSAPCACSRQTLPAFCPQASAPRAPPLTSIREPEPEFPPPARAALWPSFAEH